MPRLRNHNQQRQEDGAESVAETNKERRLNAIQVLDNRIAELEAQLLQAAIDSEEPATLQELTLDLDRLQETKRKLPQHEEADEENVRKSSTSSLDPIPDEQEEQEASRSYPAPKATPYLLKEKVPANIEYMNYADPESFMKDFSDLMIAEGIPKSQWIRICIGRLNKGMGNEEMG